MSTTAFVKRFIFSIPLDRVFTTRELLHLGTRNSIDLCLFKLVRKSIIYRLARGVFIRSSDPTKYPSIRMLAFIKAASFGKSICIAGRDAARKSQLLEGKECFTSFCFYTSGCTSSFKAGNKTIKFLSASARKRHLRDDKIGNFLKGYWHQGKGNSTTPLVTLMQVSQGLLRPERMLLKNLIRIMPVWMQKELSNNKAQPHY